MLLAPLFRVALATATPAASATPPTIVIEHSSPACQAFRERIAPAVRAVLINDLLVERSGAIFVNAAHYEVTNVPGDPKLAFDMMQLEDPENQIAQNIISAETLLDDARLAKSDNAMDRSVAALKLHLETVLLVQKAELNTISSAVDTKARHMLISAPDPAGDAAKGPDQQKHQSLKPVLPPFYGAAKVPPNEMAAMRRLTDFDLNAPYFHTAQFLTWSVRAEQPEEHRAATLLTRVADICR